MKSLLWCTGMTIAVVVRLFCADAADAQSHPSAQIQVSRGAIAPPVREPKQRAQHNIFGMMGAIGAHRFLLRMRTGRLMLVDDTEALARGTYSAPLFRGKIVLVSGSFDRTRLFHATSVSRYNTLDNQTPPDN